MRLRLWTLLAIGCDPVGPDPCVADVTIGTGLSSFEPLVPSGPLPLVFGPQGGYHLPLAFQACGMGEDLHLSVDGILGDGTGVVAVTLQEAWRPAGECCVELLDVRGFVFVDATGFDYAALAGQTVTLQAEVRDSAGLVRRASQAVVLGDAIRTETP